MFQHLMKYQKVQREKKAPKLSDLIVAVTTSHTAHHHHEQAAGFDAVRSRFMYVQAFYTCSSL
jgi:hypothetical protein